MFEIELSAGTIEYEDTGGDGPVVVLLHGVAMDGSLWRNVVADLREDHRCVVPVLPLGGHRWAGTAGRCVSTLTSRSSGWRGWWRSFWRSWTCAK